MADAAHAIVSRDARKCTGNFFIDEEVLREEGVENLEPYAITPGSSLFSDLFVDAK